MVKSELIEKPLKWSKTEQAKFGLANSDFARPKLVKMEPKRSKQSPNGQYRIQKVKTELKWSKTGVRAVRRTQHKL